MSEDVPTESGGHTDAPQRSDRGNRLASVSVDWSATLVAGVITALAVANVLPKIPW